MVSSHLCAVVLLMVLLMGVSRAGERDLCAVVVPTVFAADGWARTRERDLCVVVLLIHVLRGRYGPQDWSHGADDPAPQGQ